MYTIAKQHQYTEEIKRSKFICMAFPIQSITEAFSLLENHRDLSARHNCWAYRFGSEFRYSDDGEPAGTAGKPMYMALEYAAITNTLIVVIRWFGGIKLGTGGLCRAYGGIVSETLKKCELIEIKEYLEAKFLCPFDQTGTLYQVLKRHNVIVKSENYESGGLVCHIKIEKPFFNAFKIDLSDSSRGVIAVETFNPNMHSGV
ncbi:MAG: IMPACT family protein [Lentisphaeria bacterium]|nr:IMPACT family protein [Lentisphaeria bacterium]